MKSKKIIMMLLVIIIMLGLNTISNAALESRPGKNSWSATANNQFTNIRAMEKSGGTLGLNATIDETTYLDSTGNGLDVHMALATEWGTAAMLAVSDYGNFNSNGVANDSSQGAITTGNKTGVYQMADTNREYVSGVTKTADNEYFSIIFSADSRYRNEYSTTNSEYHKGDAIYQTAGWYNGTTGYVGSKNQAYCRGYGLFTFSTRAGDAYTYSDYRVGFARAAITCCEGL